MDVIQNTGMEISAKIEKIPVMVKFIGNSMLKFGLSEYQQFQVQLAVEETVKNIINSGNIKEEDKISIKCRRDENEVEISILYGGESFDPTKSQISSPGYNSKPRSVYFVKKNMNKVNHEFREGVNILMLIKRV